MRVLDKEEWQALKNWLKDNPSQRLHSGDKRSDGKVFLAYAPRMLNGERWVTPEQLQANTARVRKQCNARRRDPKIKEMLNAELRRKRKEDPVFREQRSRICKKWCNKNKGKVCQSVMRRITRKRNLIHPDLDANAEKTLYLLAAELTQKTGKPHQVDHIIPLISGGWHHHDNLQILPGPINASKSTNAFWTHPDYLSWKDVPNHLWPSGLAPTYSGLLAF